MLAHPWGGNVRELKGTVRSAVLLTDEDVITADKLNFEETTVVGRNILFLEERGNGKEADNPCAETGGRQPFAGC